MLLFQQSEATDVSNCIEQHHKYITKIGEICAICGKKHTCENKPQLSPIGQNNTTNKSQKILEICAICGKKHTCETSHRFLKLHRTIIPKHIT